MRFFKLFVVITAIFCLSVSGRAFAAETDMQNFRDAYLKDLGDATGYHVELMFQGPSFHSNTIADGLLGKDGYAAMTGKLSWSYTDTASGQTKQQEMPFYAERSSEATILYGKRGDVWQRENILGSLAWILDIINSEDKDTKLQYAATVTDVQTTELGNGQQRMQITFNGKALSAVKDKAVRAKISAMNEADGKAALQSVGYLNAALAENNPRCVWTIDKKTGKTTMLTADLTEIMRSYAKAMLQDSYQSKITLTDEEKEFLASIGYYYNLQVYLTQESKSADRAVIPATVKNTAQDAYIFADIKNEIISAVKK